MPDLNEQVEVVVQDADVITVPIDDTLSNSGEAADAKAVGDALALKADRSELQNSITVNGQAADAQGKILVTAADTKMSDSDNTTIKAKIEAVDEKTAGDIPMSSDPDADTIAEAINGSVNRTADAIEMSEDDHTTVKAAINAVAGDVTDLETTVAGIDAKTASDIPYNTSQSIKQHVDAMELGAVKTVYSVGPDANGDVSPASVPYADNLTSEQMEEVDAAFLQRTTGGELGISGQNAWILRLKGNIVHTGYTAESLTKTVSAVTRTAPPAITATIDEETFEAYVGVAGTYELEYDEGAWSSTPSLYGLTIANDPVDGDKITIVWDGETNAVVTVTAVPRTIPDPITADLDRDTFVSYVSTSGTTTLTYSSGEWSADPALYGLTIHNDPWNGDQIIIVYVKEVRGTITMADPDELVATGWNLYDHTNGYARVVHYSDTYGYKIGGDYTAIHFATTPTGTQTTVTPDANGKFNVSEDGYILVTDGNAANTYIYPTWTDWGSGYSGDFETYREDVIDVTTIMSANFPYGLCKVGSGVTAVYDEIDWNTKQAISRIQRMTYNAENLASAKASGRKYEYDEDYIYLERASAVINSITGEAEYTCDDHGIEFFTGTSVAVDTAILYGQNLKDKLRKDVITYRMTVAEVKGMGS
ncbi:MAG: hypothetical protein IKF99_14255 [Oscillospiraceae bacterium]|nr:hypothetical protein [Oscillospiraceae bacterium]